MEHDNENESADLNEKKPDSSSNACQDARSSMSPLRRHLNSIGIGGIFLRPPPPYMLPENYLAATSPMPPAPQFNSWEIVGRIKSSPEDFVVREVSAKKINVGKPARLFKVADLIRQDALIPQSSKGKTTKIVAAAAAAAEKEASNPENATDSEKNNAAGVKCGEQKIEDRLPPFAVVSRILQDTHGESSSALLSSLKLLHRQAHERIASLNRHKELHVETFPPMWISPIPDVGDRGAFHRALKVAFPLLCSKSIKRNDQELHPNDREKTDTWIQVSVDDSLFSLAPLLLEPEVDLPAVYLFRNRGHEEGEDGGVTCIRNSVLAEGVQVFSDSKKARRSTSQAILRLRKGLPRNERRQIHNLIAKWCRDLETSTIPTFRLSGDAIKANEEQSQNPLQMSGEEDTTAAVVVSWSKKSLRKRKRRQSRHDRKSDDESEQTNILCVLKKVQKEHFSAIQQLATALRCRPHEIGMAGIKDMQAVTFQFCTIRNSTLERAHQANSYLMRSNIQLQAIHKVNWMLTHGDLEGNKFDIIVRDVSRIKVVSCTNSSSVAREELVACTVSHCNKMVERILKHGFVNFYGEQRLGSPGDSADVGVRSFDIGRAMLQQDFEKAVDLLMAGRMICRGDTAEDEKVRRARQVWKESGGDASATLKALPVRRESMSRERVVLQGLRHYGNGNFLDALKCLPFSARIFWINAYQSFIWNLVATERIKRYGTKVVSGDLYVTDGEGENVMHVVDEECSRKIALSQVVLPLPGYNVKYPKNEIGAFYQQVLKSDDITFRRDAPLEATAKGSYRHVTAFASDLEVEYLGTDGSATFCDGPTHENESIEDMKLRFCLKKGSYATSFLRELFCTTCEREF